MLHPQDLLLVLKLVAMKESSNEQDVQRDVNMVAESNKPYAIEEVWGKHVRAWTYESLGESIGISASQAHLAMKRVIDCELARPDGSFRSRPIFDVLCAVKHIFPGRWLGPTFGMPTGYAGPPLNKYIRQGSHPTPVWPSSSGPAHGIGYEPIYKTAPEAAQQDAKLYELLVMVDALRMGAARERNFARSEFARMLHQNI